MNQFKFTIAVVMAMLCAFTTKAADTFVNFYVDPLDIEVVDGKATVNVYYDTNVATLNTFQLDIYLPEGFAMEKNSRGVIKITKNPDEDVIYDHAFASVDRTDEDDPFYRIVAYSATNSYLLDGDNYLFSFYVTAPADFSPTSYLDDCKATLRNIIIAEDATTPIGHYPADYTFYFRPQGVPTGVESVAADADDDDVIYNLQGIRMQRPLAPGLYIINGQKTAVK